MDAKTLGELRASGWDGSRSVKDELRENLMRKLALGETLFPGVVGYEDTVASSSACRCRSGP